MRYLMLLMLCSTLTIAGDSEFAPLQWFGQDGPYAPNHLGNALPDSFYEKVPYEEMENPVYHRGMMPLSDTGSSVMSAASVSQGVLAGTARYVWKCLVWPGVRDADATLRPTRPLRSELLPTLGAPHSATTISVASSRLRAAER